MDIVGLLWLLPEPTTLAARFLCVSFSHSSFLQARHTEPTRPFPRETAQRIIQFLYSAQIPRVLGDILSLHPLHPMKWIRMRWIRKLKLLFTKEKNEKPQSLIPSTDGDQQGGSVKDLCAGSGWSPSIASCFCSLGRNCCPLLSVAPALLYGRTYLVYYFFWSHLNLALGICSPWGLHVSCSCL